MNKRQICADCADAYEKEEAALKSANDRTAKAEAEVLRLRNILIAIHEHVHQLSTAHPALTT